MDPRAFNNPYPEWDAKSLVENDQLSPRTREMVHEAVKSLLKKHEEKYKHEVNWSDNTVYTGTAGVAYMYLHMYDKLDSDKPNSRYLQQALYFMEKAVRGLKRRKLSFMCGDAGPLALGAVIYDRLGQKDKCEHCLERLASRQEDVCQSEEIPDELLYGRIGYLYALLFVQRHLGTHAVPAHVLDEVIDVILKSGQSLSRKLKSECPLMYEWHGKLYLGAAHGIVGILYVLLQANDSKHKSRIHELVRASIDYLMTLRFPSGNYPSSIGSATGDKLVHWCHGAPGWIHLFIQAYKVFGDERYLEEAKSCGEVLWRRGLLKKGYGICHGVAGNAYGFLGLFNVTKDQKYMHRSLKFAEFCMDYGRHGCGTPDHPYSLFEGLAGTIYFLIDIMDPVAAKFPAFEL